MTKKTEKRGGKREGAGRPEWQHPDLKKHKLSTKLPMWLLVWLLGHKKPIAILIEDALREKHDLEPPDG